jgi:hypothetical protein
MEWHSNFVIYRVLPDGKLLEIFNANSLKDAKYWITYIAEPGDLLCNTPLHPKHSKKDKYPEYWCHKPLKGRVSSDQEDWKKIAQQRSFNFVFPQEHILEDSQNTVV